MYIYANNDAEKTESWLGMGYLYALAVAVK